MVTASLGFNFVVQKVHFRVSAYKAGSPSILCTGLFREIGHLTVVFLEEKEGEKWGEMIPKSLHFSCWLSTLIPEMPHREHECWVSGMQLICKDCLSSHVSFRHLPNWSETVELGNVLPSLLQVGLSLCVWIREDLINLLFYSCWGAHNSQRNIWRTFQLVRRGTYWKLLKDVGCKELASWGAPWEEQLEHEEIVLFSFRLHLESWCEIDSQWCKVGDLERDGFGFEELRV